MKQAKKFVFSRREPELPADLTATAGWFDGRDTPLVEQWITGADLMGRAAGRLRVEGELANLRTRAMSLVRVQFIDCRMTGLSGGEVDAQDVLIRDGDQRYCQFRSSRFKAAEFDGCNFEEADFQETDFTGAVFRRCNLRNVEMGKAKLYDADLRGSVEEGLQVGVEGLRGAVVDAAQAMCLAMLMGIRIE